MGANPLEIVGLVAVAYLALRASICLLSLIYRRVLCRSFDIPKKCGGKWALVTGSTDGIGKAYAFAMAKRGLNVVLVSRSQSKLDQVKGEIQEQYPQVEIRCIAVDFASDNVDDYMVKIATQTRGCDVGVLVNNVGMSYEHPVKFHALETETNTTISSLVDVNITSCNAMLLMFLPIMVERKAGVVINISSMSALLATPLLSAYSGTKAYIDLLSRGLVEEYRGDGITVQCVLPGYVASKMSKMRKNFIAPNPDEFVESALGRLGIDDHTTGYWVHDLMVSLVSILPSAILAKITHSQMSKIQKLALRKKMRKDKSS